MFACCAGEGRAAAFSPSEEETGCLRRWARSGAHDPACAGRPPRPPRRRIGSAAACVGSRPPPIQARAPTSAAHWEVAARQIQLADKRSRDETLRTSALAVTLRRPSTARRPVQRCLVGRLNGGRATSCLRTGLEKAPGWRRPGPCSARRSRPRHPRRSSS